MRVWTALCRARGQHEAPSDRRPISAIQPDACTHPLLHSRSASFVLTPGGVIREATQGLLDLLEAPCKERLIGTRLADFCKTLGERERLLEALRGSGHVSNRLVPMQTFQHKTRWVRVTVHTIRGALGHIAFREGFLEDVTDWKIASTHLAAATRRADALHHLIRAIGGLDGPSLEPRMHLVEEALQSLSGCSCTLILGDGTAGAPIPEQLPTLQLASLQPWIDHCIRTGSTVRVPASLASDEAPPWSGDPSRETETLIFPIPGSPSPLGVLLLSLSSLPPELGDEDAELLASLLRILGISLDAQRLQQTASREQQRMEHLIGSLTRIQERERGHIARELHDGIGQALTALEFGLQRAKQKLSPASLHEVRTALQECEAISSELHEAIRELSHGLRPSVLDDVGLKAAMESYFIPSASRLGIQAEFATAGLDTHRLPREHETALYRISQEALTNAARHGEASVITLRIVRTDHRVIWSFRDNGKGFHPPDLPDPPQPGQGIGLLEMRKRIALLGGSLRLQSAKGQGTALLATLPLSPEPNDEAPHTPRHSEQGGRP